VTSQLDLIKVTTHVTRGTGGVVTGQQQGHASLGLLLREALSRLFWPVVSILRNNS